MRSKKVLTIVLVFMLAPLFAAAQASPKDCTKTITVPCAPAVRHAHHRRVPQPAAVAPKQEVQVTVVPVPVPASPVRDEYMDHILGQIAYTNAISVANNTEAAKANALAYQLDAQTAQAEVAIDQQAQDTNQFRAQIERDLANANIDLIGTQRSVMKWGVAEGFFHDATMMAGMIWQPGENFAIQNGSASTAAPTTNITGPTVTSTSGVSGSGNSANSISTSVSTKANGGSVVGSGNSKATANPVSIAGSKSTANPIISSSSGASASAGASARQNQDQGQSQSQSQGQQQTANPSQSQSQTGAPPVSGNPKQCKKPGQ